jgi:F-type H+-transporting ATPase subunit epsilon
MSTKYLKLKIVTPERLILEEEVESVTIPTVEGEIGVFPGHLALISAIKSGDIVGKKNGEEIPMAVSGGFVEVRPGSNGETEVVVLADFAEHVAEISDEVIAKAKARAEELMKQKQNGEVVDFEHFEGELERSLTRVKIGDKWKKRKYRA